MSESKDKFNLEIDWENNNNWRDNLVKGNVHIYMFQLFCVKPFSFVGKLYVIVHKIYI